ncbi:MAG TPA: type II toxin-antitoxin system HicB family antitoxin [Ensifer sp.]|nr:type II toxin-antitoxin system HicB family antitoxin [Ensifer sp.]
MRNYIGLIHKDADSDYGVSFPDFPGVVTAGPDLDDARAMAQEALALHVDGLIEDGEAIPEPSTLEAIMSNPENKDAVAVLIPLKTQNRKVVRLNITLPEDVLVEIDAYAQAHGLTRSGFLASAAMRQIEDPEHPVRRRRRGLSA